MYWPGTNVIKTQHNCFNWKGAPSIFTRKGETRPSLKQVIEYAQRHNYEATLGASAGYEIRTANGN